MRQHLTDAGARQHVLHPDHRGLTLGTEIGEGLVELCGDLGGVGGAGEQHDLGLGGELGRGAHQMHQALLPRDASDERDVRLVEVDAQVAHEFGLGNRVELFGVDAVADHMHPVGVDLGVGLEDALAHLAGDGDDSVRGRVGGALGP